MLIRRYYQILPLFLLLICPIPLAFAAPQFSVETPKESIVPGESFTIHIIAKWPKSEGSFRFHFSNMSFENLELIKQGESQEAYLRGGEEFSQRNFQLELIPLNLGIAEIKEFTIHYLNQTPESSGEFTVPAFQAEVTKEGSLGLIILGSLIFLSISILGLFYFKNNKKNKKTPNKVNSVEEQVIKQLEKLIDEREKIPQNIQIKNWSTFLTKFIIEFYSLNHINLSEQEIIEALLIRGSSKKDAGKIQELFNKLSQAKYSGTQMPDKDFNLLRNEITGFVRNRHMARSY